MLARPPLPQFVAFGFAAPPAPDLDPQEALIISPKAAPSTRLSFALGRAAAHQALSKLAAPEHPLLRKPSGEAAWPTGFTGSIAHTEGMACAIAAHAKDVRSLGIDIEAANRLSSTTIADKICTAQERTWADAHPQNLLSLFCAKEALFKCLYPCVQKFFGFQDAELSSFPLTTETLRLRLNTTLASGFEAGFSIDVQTSTSHGYCLATVCLLGPNV